MSHAKPVSRSESTSRLLRLVDRSASVPAHQPRTVFDHIPKTAGTSVRAAMARAFGESGDLPETPCPHPSPSVKDSGGDTSPGTCGFIQERRSRPVGYMPRSCVIRSTVSSPSTSSIGNIARKCWRARSGLLGDLKSVQTPAAVGFEEASGCAPSPIARSQGRRWLGKSPGPGQVAAGSQDGTNHHFYSGLRISSPPIDPPSRPWRKWAPVAMPWYCPACKAQIRHSDLDDRPRSGQTYRCHVCRLDLELDVVSQKLIVAPLKEKPE